MRRSIFTVYTPMGRLGVFTLHTLPWVVQFTWEMLLLEGKFTSLNPRGYPRGISPRNIEGNNSAATCLLIFPINYLYIICRWDVKLVYVVIFIYNSLFYPIIPVPLFITYFLKITKFKIMGPGKIRPPA